MALNSNVYLCYLQAPNYPDPGRCWDIVDKYKVTIFYTAPTLVRSLMRDSNEVRFSLTLHADLCLTIYRNCCKLR